MGHTTLLARAPTTVQTCKRLHCDNLQQTHAGKRGGASDWPLQLKEVIDLLQPNTANHDITPHHTTSRTVTSPTTASRPGAVCNCHWSHCHDGGHTPCMHTCMIRRIRYTGHGLGTGADFNCMGTAYTGWHRSPRAGVSADTDRRNEFTMIFNHKTQGTYLPFWSRTCDVALVLPTHPASRRDVGLWPGYCLAQSRRSVLDSSTLTRDSLSLGAPRLCVDGRVAAEKRPGMLLTLCLSRRQSLSFLQLGQKPLCNLP